MLSASQWRTKFNALAEDMFREASLESPTLTQEVDEAITMELALENIAFDVTHNAETYPDRLLVECQFGPLALIQTEQAEAVFTRLLENNLMLTRTSDAAFGVNTGNNSVVFSFNFALDSINAAGILDRMQRIVPQVQQWRQTCLLSNPDCATLVDKLAPNETPEPHRQQFLALLNDLSAEMDHETLSDIPDDDELEIEIRIYNTDFKFIHNRIHQPQKIIIECNFGLLPDIRTEAALLRLLELNQEFIESRQMLFSIDEETHDVIYTRTGELTNESGHSLLITMRQMSLMAEIWEESFYLPDDDEEIDDDEINENAHITDKLMPPATLA